MANLALTPNERKRMLRLVWKSRGRRRNLTVREQAQLRRLVKKVDPRGAIRDPFRRG